MKKLIRFRVYILTIAFFIIFIASCEDNIENYNETKSPAKKESKFETDQRIEDARIFFETEVKNSFSSSTQKNVDHDKKRKSIRKHLMWDEAYFKQLSVGFGIVIPLSYDKEYYVLKGKTKFSLSQLSYVLMYWDECKNWKVELVTTLPNQTFSESSNENQTFSGLVIIEDWGGNFIKGYQYKDNQIFNFIIEESRTKAEDDCEWTDWYSCACVDNDCQCTFSHSTISCGSGSPTFPTSSGGTVSNDYPPGTNGSGTNTDETSDNDNENELNKYDQIKLKQVKIDLLNGYCPNQQIFNDVWNSIDFQINSSIESNAVYDPLSNTITFRNYYSINNATVLQEVFHSFQNSSYPGGISQYENSPGELNIEFEAWLYTEIWLFVEDEELKFEAFLSSNLRQSWNEWILEIADNGFTPNVLEDYGYWMSIFGATFPQYNNPLTNALQTPQAAINIFNLCNYK